MQLSRLASLSALSAFSLFAKAKDVKVIDTFPYNGGPILQLQELYVDKHAAVIAPYKQKNWYREHTQRDASSAYIRAVQAPEMIVLACDVDELVRPATVASLKLMYHDLNEPSVTLNAVAACKEHSSILVLMSIVQNLQKFPVSSCTTSNPYSDAIKSAYECNSRHSHSSSCSSLVLIRRGVSAA
eukprot:1136-Heterococcus_DN1.PRE.3